MFSKSKVKIIIVWVIVLMILTLGNYLVSKNEPDIEKFVKNEYKKWGGNDLGKYTTYESVTKELSTDSVLFKIIISNSDTRVIADGIAHKENRKWQQYSYFIFKTFKHSDNLESAKKYYLDGTLTSW